jgi:hypothetical protein
MSSRRMEVQKEGGSIRQVRGKIDEVKGGFMKLSERM